MSVDVFGRTLKKSEGTRGPPGAGYKFTHDGQFDLDNKRLCNLADPIETGDAVNLHILKQLVESEVRSVSHITAGLRTEIDNLHILLTEVKQIIPEIERKVIDLYDLFESHKDDLDKKIQDLTTTTEDIKNTFIFKYGKEENSSRRIT